MVHEPIKPDDEVFAKSEEPLIPWNDGVPDWFYQLVRGGPGRDPEYYQGSGKNGYALFDSNGNYMGMTRSWNEAREYLSRNPNGCCVKYDPTSDKCTVYGGAAVGFTTAGQGEFQSQINHFMDVIHANEAHNREVNDARQSVKDYYDALSQYQSRQESSDSDSGSDDEDQEVQNDGSVPEDEPSRGGLYDDGFADEFSGGLLR